MRRCSRFEPLSDWRRSSLFTALRPLNFNSPGPIKEYAVKRTRGLNWPSVWVRMGGTPKEWHVARGEIGVLKSVRYNANHPHRIYLIVAHEGAEYIGCLLFDYKLFCEEVAEQIQAMLHYANRADWYLRFYPAA